MTKDDMITARFRPELDRDIKQQYLALPPGKRSDAVRDALRIYFGINRKLVYTVQEQTVRPQSRPLVMTNGGKRK